MGTLEEVFAAADYLTLHVGLTPQTFGMINSESIRTMKKGARLVNCARGELVKESDLAQALKAGHLAGAALDVFTEEPLKNSPLAALDNVILTPHVGGSTQELEACWLPDCPPGEGVSEARCFSMRSTSRPFGMKNTWDT